MGRRILCGTVELNEATIRKYIEKHDIAIDRLGVKECEDPFKDSGFRRWPVTRVIALVQTTRLTGDCLSVV